MAIFNSLGSNYNLKYVLKSLFSNSDGQDEKLKKFLEEKYNGKAILTYKGREALILALKILDLPKESQVAINGFTCFAVYKAIEEADLIPVCLDLKEKNTDLNFSVKTLEEKIKENKNIKVVIIQNTLGYPADIEKITKLCQEKNITLIEDLAHCVGTKYLPAEALAKEGENGQEAGTVGDFTILSFSQDKVIDAISGGALVIRNKKFQKSENDFVFKQPKNQLKDKLYPYFTFKIRFLYNIGVGKIFHFILKKLNLLSKPMQEDLYDFYSLPNWYCYLALREFNHLSQQLKHRKEIAKMYAKNLNKNLLSKSITEKINISSNLRFPISVENRNSLINFLKKYKIFVSDIWYDDVAKDCPNAVGVSKKILNLPTHINVSKDDALKISERINIWFESK